MFFQKDQKKIGSILKNIYKPHLSKKNIDSLKDQIFELIKTFNKKNSKKKN